MESEPVATIKVTFDELPEQVFLLLNVLYVFLIISSIYLSARVADVVFFYLNNIVFYSPYRIFENRRGEE